MDKYQIIGKDKRYGVREVYGTFDSLKSCLEYREILNRAYGHIIKFEVLSLDVKTKYEQ